VPFLCSVNAGVPCATLQGAQCGHGSTWLLVLCGQLVQALGDLEAAGVPLAHIEAALNDAAAECSQVRCRAEPLTMLLPSPARCVTCAQQWMGASPILALRCNTLVSGDGESAAGRVGRGSSVCCIPRQCGVPPRPFCPAHTVILTAPGVTLVATSVTAWRL
jgi:hypothetical protein